jgi:hypothetical protein
MKVNDNVKSTRGDHIGMLGKIVQRNVRDLQYTSFVVCRVEFELNVFEWINEMYLVKA